MKERTELAHHVYGPVPSRRLGLSLGVDLIPFKTCSYDCLYCQLGKTTEKCVARKEYVDTATVLHQIEKAISLKQRIDYITFSGSGEPTLHSGIGFLIQETKRITTIPVAVITNSSLLYEEAVQEALLHADLVVPSLDAGGEETFHVINRPHDSIQFSDMVEGLERFSQSFKGKLWLEVMFVAGINDSDEALDALRLKLKQIRRDKIQLNTVFRPPADEAARAVGAAWLQRVNDLLGDTAEIVTDFRGNMQDEAVKNDKKRILGLIRRRPVTVSDIIASLGMHRNEVIKLITILEKHALVKPVLFEGRTYYEQM